MRMLLAILAAAATAIVAFMGLFAGCAGVAWIFVFGDDPWPEWSNAVLILLPAAGALVAAVSVFRSVMESRPAG